ncbi:hypothetical protein BHU72_00840 [Desulfuribacillus stibiiarsenatis]|uniref:DUF1269 domain-containing protein n=1 Tax=Desulfuribacillus stibiiarsenatis TaxID=1390249 RepID=A0A1E5L9Y9_9FIRM|nr:hypothetical protein [Desulfuribacillus stibiiarsenatis]OEH86844.1 hypothetical protein BHU72_00840 [Desulfuribacillus stibiiarsenatis]
MQVFSIFEHSSYIELAISALEEAGVKRENILCVSLDNRVEERRLFDTLHRADGISLFDKGAAIGTAFSVIGASVGFVLEWGPIFWGMIGAVTGFIIGFAIDYVIYKVIHRRTRVIKGKKAEVILVVKCSEALIEKTEALLWEHLALGVAKLD